MHSKYIQYPTNPQEGCSLPSTIGHAPLNTIRQLFESPPLGGESEIPLIAISDFISYLKLTRRLAASSHFPITAEQYYIRLLAEIYIVQEEHRERETRSNSGERRKGKKKKKKRESVAHPHAAISIYEPRKIR